MTLIERLPEMSDEGVRNLLDNARRLEQSGTDKQRAASAEILPAVEAEAVRRQETRKEAMAVRRAAAADMRKAAKARKVAS